MRTNALLSAVVSIALFLVATPVFADEVCHDGLAITKFKLIHHYASGDAEVYSGIAESGLAVDFVLEWNEASHPSGEGHSVTVTYNYGDGTQGSSDCHTYSDGGTKNVSVTVTCTYEGDTLQAHADGLTVYVIEDMEITHVGGAAVGANNRMSFNDANGVSAHVLPAGTPGDGLIDWETVFAAPAFVYALNSSNTSLSLSASDWPDQNFYWGSGCTLYATIDGQLSGAFDQNGELLQGGAAYLSDSVSFAAFYNATGTEKDGSDPNWFHYYKEEEGGWLYNYANQARSSSTLGGGIMSIKMGNTAYTGSEYIDTSVVGGQLQVDGWSSTYRYYAYFIGVLAHETEHATNQTSDGPPTDRDDDWLTNYSEIGMSSTDPDDAYSARDAGGKQAWGAGFLDGEVYAGGPVEKDGIVNADTSEDWAHPGTNWH